MERKCICRDNPRAVGLCVIAWAMDERLASKVSHCRSDDRDARCPDSRPAAALLQVRAGSFQTQRRPRYGCAGKVRVRSMLSLRDSVVFSFALLGLSQVYNASACCLRCFPLSVCIILPLSVQGGCDGGCSCGSCGVHLSLLPMPQRLAVHLSSINHRERLLSPAVAIVSGPETVLGCAVASREEEKEEREGKEN